MGNQGPHASRKGLLLMDARAEILGQFESLGDNCEFGLVQRIGGIEPLGLLRFAGFHIPVEYRLNRLLDALERGFSV